MSRSGYSDDYDGNNWDLIRWRGAVNAAIKGSRGQAFLKEMLAAFDAMPEKRLIAEDLVKDRVVDPEAGATVREVCAIGAVGAVRGVDMTKLDPEDREGVAGAFGIAPAMAAEIVYMNDEGTYNETPEARFTRMRQWIVNQIKPEEKTDV